MPLTPTKTATLYHTGKTLVQTSVADVYAAGDCTDRVFGQAITATAMGCMAAILASS